LNLLILASAVAGHGGNQLAVLIDDPDGGLGKLDGDDLASMAEADQDALARDLDAATPGHPQLGLPAGLVRPGGRLAAGAVGRAGRESASHDAQPQRGP
jgi:hypothetical protein